MINGLTNDVEFVELAAAAPAPRSSQTAYDQHQQLQKEILHPLSRTIDERTGVLQYRSLRHGRNGSADGFSIQLAGRGEYELG